MRNPAFLVTDGRIWSGSYDSGLKPTTNVFIVTKISKIMDLEISKDEINGAVNTLNKIALSCNDERIKQSVEFFGGDFSTISRASAMLSDMAKKF